MDLPRIAWVTGLVLAMSLGYTCARPKSPCVEQSLEYREEMANVVISGTVKEIMPDDNGKKMYKSEIEVKRVFKGENIVNQFANYEDPISHHKMVMIEGFGDDEICENQVRRYDTRIFLLNKGTNGDLKLNSSIVRITLTNLEHTDAVVKGRRFYFCPQLCSICTWIIPYPCLHFPVTQNFVSDLTDHRSVCLQIGKIPVVHFLCHDRLRNVSIFIAELTTSLFPPQAP